MKIGEKDTHVGLGTPSIILIVLVVSMVVFALLALRSAQNEKKLAEKKEIVKENEAHGNESGDRAHRKSGPDIS